jgi:hypothetical protein
VNLGLGCFSGTGLVAVAHFRSCTEAILGPEQDPGASLPLGFLSQETDILHGAQASSIFLES